MSIETARERTPVYDAEWFKRRAIDSVERIDDTRFDFSDSLLLYVPGADETYEAVQETDTPYHRLVTAPERAYLESIAARIVDALPDQFAYIDLGPGTEHKEQFIFDAAHASGKKILYRPVDISPRYLRLSVDYVRAQGIAVDPINSSFEELPSKLKDDGVHRFVSLGLTYSNYEPSRILPLLQQIGGVSSHVFSESQLRERIDMSGIVDMYSTAVYPMAEKKLELLGIDPSRDIAGIQVDDGVRAWVELAHVPQQLAERGVVAGNKLLVFESLRPTKDQFVTDVRSVFPDTHFFETDSQFLGALSRGEVA